MAVSPVFYQVKPENLPLYIDLGLTLSKLGEEARVALDSFSLEGAARADLRQTHRRASRDGAQFQIVPRAEVGAIVGELRAVSEAWLEEKKTAEKRFSLGYFDERYLMHFDCGVVRCNGAIVAFANLWPGASKELSVDLMRYNADAPKGVIDFLLIECMFVGQIPGYQWFNLGMRPLSGLESTRSLRPGTSSAAWCSATARCSTLRRAAKIQGKVLRCGGRDISPLPTAWRWPAPFSMSPRSSPGAWARSCASERNEARRIRFRSLRDFAHLGKKCLDAGARSPRSRRSGR